MRPTLGYRLLSTEQASLYRLPLVLLPEDLRSPPQNGVTLPPPGQPPAPQRAPAPAPASDTAPNMAAVSERRSRDLGYHHAIRNPNAPPRPNAAADPKAYMRGFEAGKGHAATGQPPMAPVSTNPPAPGDPYTPPSSKLTSPTAFYTGRGHVSDSPDAVAAKGKLAQLSNDRKIKPTPRPSVPTSDPNSMSKVAAYDANEVLRADAHRKHGVIKGHLMGAAGKAADRLRAAGHNVGDMINCGLGGCVYGADPGNVYKFDKGDNEAKLAHAVMRNPELQKVSILPKYKGVYHTDVADTLTGAPIHAILREDLSDAQFANPEPWSNMSKTLQDIAHRVSRNEFQNDRPDATLTGFAARVAAKEGRTYQPRTARDYLAKAIDGAFAEQERRIHPADADKFKQAREGFAALAKHGIAPCDMHTGNWGQRANGQLAIRDGGCYKVVD